MSTLIVQLPPAASGASTEYRYAHTRDGVTLDSQGSALATTLPQPGVGRDVVALVPARLLSWHRVELPKGALSAGPVRLRAVLEGLLEERLLDEPAAVHLAVQSTGAGTWVAACDKAWLQAALAPLEAAGRPVSRLLPELAPRLLAADAAAAPAETWQVMSEADGAWLVRVQDQGLSHWPLPAFAQAWRRPGGLSVSPEAIWAEPAVVAQATALLADPAGDGPQVQMQQAAERWVAALDSPWDLAQFEFSNSGRQRALKKFSNLGSELLHAPRWRAARWGLGVLALAQLLGVNAWAWKEKTSLEQLRAESRTVLTQTFPQVKLVVDAPVQMQRELALLRQSTGAATRRDLENLLSALGQALPPGEAWDAASLEYGEAELRLKVPGIKDDSVQALRLRLEPQGFTLRQDGNALTLGVAPEVAAVAPAGGQP